MEFWAASPRMVEHLRQHPDELAAIEAEGARLQAELAAIEALSDENACRLCGAQVVLTEEHAPSRAAGNKGTLIGERIDAQVTKASGVVTWAADVSHGGATFRTLCAPCNRNSGRWFNPSYVALVQACGPVANAASAGAVCRVRGNHRPLVAKQAIISLVATSQAGLTARHSDLRTLLLSRRDRRPLRPLRLWAYVMANRMGMYTGIVPSLDVRRRAGHLVAGFAFWPLGWLLTLEDVVVPGAEDVSGWLELDADRRPVTIELPCLWTNHYPGDFRSPVEVLGQSR